MTRPIALLLLSSVLAACAPDDTTPAPIVLTDGLGREVTLAAPAARVVSLAPSNTELLYEVGAGAQVVGCDEFSDFPAEASALPRVGGSAGTYDADAIVALAPDLILAAEINTAAQVEALEARGLTVFYLSNPDDLTGLFENMRTVGALTGRSAQATALISSLTTRVEAIIAKLSMITTHYNVYYELDATDPTMPYTAGPGSYIHTLLERAGDHNIGGSLSVPFGQLSAAEIIAQNPDFIVLGDGAYGVTPESVGARPGWSDLNAVRDGHVVVFDNDTVSRPTARIVDAIENLARLFHPEVFP